jgi:hypothetical protein
MQWLDARYRDRVARDQKSQTAIVRIGDGTYIANVGYVNYETCEEKNMANKAPRTKPELSRVTSKEVGG